MSSRKQEGGANEEDVLWYLALSGRKTAGTASDAAREARVVRTSVLRLYEENQAAVTADEWYALRNRMQTEGLISRDAATNPHSGGGRRSRWFIGIGSAIATAALIALMVSNLSMLKPPQDDVSRGDVPTIMIIADDVESEAARIGGLIQSANVKSSRRVRDGDVEFELDLSKEVPSASRSLFERSGVVIEGDQKVLIVIRKRPI